MILRNCNREVSNSRNFSPFATRSRVAKDVETQLDCQISSFQRQQVPSSQTIIFKSQEQSGYSRTNHTLLSNCSVTIYIYRQSLYLEYEKKKRSMILNKKSKIPHKKHSLIENRTSSSLMVINNTGLSIITLDHLRHGPTRCKKKKKTM